MRRALAWNLAIAAVAVESAAWSLGGPSALAQLFSNFFTQFAFASSLLVHGLITPRGGHWTAGAVVVSAASAVGASQVVGVGARQALHIALLMAGAVGTVALARSSIVGPDRSRSLDALMSVAIVSMCVAIAPFFLWLSSGLNPVHDLYVLAFEDTLGPRFSVWGVKLFSAAQLPAFMCAVCYLALPAGIVAVDTLQRFGERENDILVAFIVSTVIGFSLYFVFPVVGPLTAFGPAYPDHLPEPGTVIPRALVVSTLAPRNGMPSLHAAWAMLLWASAARLRPAERMLIRTFVAGNIVAAMGLRDTHWITDLIVAAPMTLAVLGLCHERQPLYGGARGLAVSGGLAMVAGWFLLLWTAPAWLTAVPVLPWAVVAGTLWICVDLHRRLNV